MNAKERIEQMRQRIKEEQLEQIRKELKESEKETEMSEQVPPDDQVIDLDDVIVDAPTEPIKPEPIAPEPPCIDNTVVLPPKEKTPVTKKDFNLYVLAWIVVSGFLAICGLLALNVVPPGVNNLAYVLLGTLATGFTTILSYFFGSSQGSDTKSSLLANSIPLNSLQQVTDNLHLKRNLT
jgi:hypothetical protein